MLGILLAAAAFATASPSPTPSPAPSSLRIIVTVRASTFCSAVRSMAVPVGLVVTTNDNAFSSLTAHEVSVDIHDPDRWAVAAKTAKVMYAVVQNLVLAENVLAKSWQQYPKGKDANVDAMRQRVQNVIDLQRAITNDYYRNGHGDDGVVTDFSADAVDVSHPSGPRIHRINTGAALIDGLREADAKASDDIRHEIDPEEFPVADARSYVRRAGAFAQKRELDLQEYAFSSEIAAASKTCGL